MLVRVHYTNGIVSDNSIMDFDKLLSFGKRLTILSQRCLTEEETKEYEDKLKKQPSVGSGSTGPR